MFMRKLFKRKMVPEPGTGLSCIVSDYDSEKVIQQEHFHMASYQHRAAPGWQNLIGSNRGRYSLRGNPQVTPVLQQTITQQRKNRVSKHVDKNWRITRANTRSRGLGREGQTCYLLSGIQALLHLPRFFSWISSHNSAQAGGPALFPCRSTDEIEEALIAKLGDGSTDLDLDRCPACVIKRFVQSYWSDVHPSAGAFPVSWRSSHEQLKALRRLDRRLFPLTPGADAAEEQDPVETQDRLLEACLASTDHT
jgi:hypothetical protein